MGFGGSGFNAVGPKAMKTNLANMRNPNHDGLPWTGNTGGNNMLSGPHAHRVIYKPGQSASKGGHGMHGKHEK